MAFNCVSWRLQSAWRLPSLVRTITTSKHNQQASTTSSSSGGGAGEGVNMYTELTIPPYEDKIGEPVNVKRARLLYQSRKRGMLENDLLLSGFAGKVLSSMEEPQLSLYDRLINLPSNDWDLYYWATGVKETPAEFDHEVMKALKLYVKNEKKEDRTRQPDL